MEYKILEANGVENENIDGAALNNFTARGKNGILKNVLSECSVTSSGSSVVVGTGEIIIQGFRIKITDPYTVQAQASASPLTYQIVARITLSGDRSVIFDMLTRPLAALTQSNIWASESGVYEVEVAQFQTGSSGVTSAKRTLEVIGAPEVLTEDYISTLLDRFMSASLDKFAPLFKVHIFIDNTNPAELYGGYWLRIKDAFLWASGDTQYLSYTDQYGQSVTTELKLGARGGEMYHKLAINEMPAHYHNMLNDYSVFSNPNKDQAYNWGSEYSRAQGTINRTATVGGNEAHNNIPPYYAVYAWVRVTEEWFNSYESL